MSKKLVAYFSASGVTAGVAKNLAQAAGAELYEIKPAVKYTSSDLNWNDSGSRSSVEMRDKSSRPELADKDAKLDGVDKIFLGFPIWWYVAPTIINSFLESYDFTGKTIILFATSGGSGFGDAVNGLKPSAPGAVIREGKLFRRNTSVEELKKWLKSEGLGA
ncbi:MAG: NAD(P)H-dependent oxidoreductase [Synergistaceae bacterium]|nr:NAD(P)H-dependent oxidoreductase [Synergistaceae bacterium]